MTIKRDISVKPIKDVWIAMVEFEDGGELIVQYQPSMTLPDMEQD